MPACEAHYARIINMIYMGGKFRYAKQILEAIGPITGAWVEPFLGGGNVMMNVKHPRRFGYDVSEDAVCVLDAMSKGWLPPSGITEEQYNEQKKAPLSPLRGHCAYALSFGAKRFGGWSRNKRGYDYVGWAERAAAKQGPQLAGATIALCSYDQLLIPQGSTVYCDPPYAGTSGYGVKFDHDAFWAWTSVIAKHSRVYVSEYTAPDFAKEIWRKEVKPGLRRKPGSKDTVEKLFQVHS